MVRYPILLFPLFFGLATASMAGQTMPAEPPAPSPPPPSAPADPVTAQAGAEPDCRPNCAAQIATLRELVEAQRRYIAALERRLRDLQRPVP